jgi:UDPglucose--hexose-1-phosphate uridylyltransferase
MEVAGGERVVGREDGVVAFCPAAGRAPYEVLVAPTSPEEHAFESALLPAALELLADSIRRLHSVEERVPLNAWLHTGSHWHLELVPRLTIAAGLELGAGVYVNPLPPEEAALRLRSAVV